VDSRAAYAAYAAYSIQLKDYKPSLVLYLDWKLRCVDAFFRFLPSGILTRIGVQISPSDLACIVTSEESNVIF
jgi:hypothetical protein